MTAPLKILYTPNTELRATRFLLQHVHMFESRRSSCFEETDNIARDLFEKKKCRAQKSKTEKQATDCNLPTYGVQTAFRVSQGVSVHWGGELYWL